MIDFADRALKSRWCTSKSFSWWWVGVLAAALLTSAVPTIAQVNVTTAAYNNQRTSVNSSETILTPSNVNSTDFGKLFSQSVLGYIFAQPLYVPGVTINGAVHNVVYVATEHDSVYAFDADSNTGANAMPLWKTSFLSSGVTTVPSSSLTCSDILPEYGITGTPVIDLSTKTLYVVAETLENNGASFVKKIHALDITTGLEKPGSPLAISASVTVPGQNAVPFAAKWENQRPGLLLHNGVVYVGFSSHCDNQDWLGWILGYTYNQSSFSQVFVFSTEPSSVNGRQAGIWMSGQGLSMDMGSNLFVATGNGQFDTTVTPPINYGDSIIRIDLSIGPTVQDYFTPHTQSTMDLNDGDLGSGGIAMLFNQAGPNPSLLVQAGKDGVIHVVNQTNMGHFNSSSDNIVQEVSGFSSLYSSPVYFNGKVYFWGVNDVVKAFTVTNGRLSTSFTDSGSDTINFPGATPVISANGTSNAILWALDGDDWVEGSGPGGPAVLYAYNPANLSAGSLYNSSANLTRDNPGGAIKFAVPTVANGKVYVGAAGELSVFGELIAGAPSITSANNTTFSVGTDGNFTVMASGTPAPSLTETGALPTGVTFVNNGNGTATLSGTPASGTSGTYTLTITASNGVGAAANQTFTLTVNQAPAITNLSPTSGPVGTAVTITGANFGSTGTVTFNGTTATTTTWTATSIVTSVPSGATTGNVVVKVGGVASNGLAFTVTTSGAPTINYGSGFTAGGMILLGSAKLNGTALQLTDGGTNEAAAAWYGVQTNIQSFTTDFSFLVSGGTNPTADGFTFTMQGQSSSAIGNLGGSLGYGSNTTGALGIPTSVAVKFDLFSNNGEGVDSTGLYTDGASPTTPAVDMTGSGVNLHSGDPFHAHITYDGTNLAMTITDTITNGTFSHTWPINIPSIVAGNTAYVGFTGGTGGLTAIQAIQSWTFTNANTSTPTITSLNPTSGPVGTAVTITGTNFGSTGTVTFNGTTATTTTWTATSIVTSVPSGATTGNVVVKVGGVASNGVNFTVTTICGENGQSGLDGANGDWGFGTPCVTGSDANGYTPTSIQYWVGSPSSASFDLGIYADSSGSPGSLLCHTGTTTVTPNAGWNNISLSGKSCPTLSPNTRYWMGYITSSNSIQQGIVSGTCPGTSLVSVYTNSQLGSAVLPSPFGATAGTPSCYSIYLMLSDK